MSAAYDEKRVLRRKLKKRRPSKEIAEAESELLCRIILESPLYRAAGMVAAYAALPGEADLEMVLNRALRVGKRIALPVTGRDLRITFREVKDLSTLAPDAWGIAAPGEDCPEVKAEDIDLLIVPLAAIDLRGRRLGKGGGCYDRWFAAYPETLQRSMGAALRYQVIDAVPAGPEDRALPRAVTPDGLMEFTE